jgi:hypothetical protein
VARWQSTLTKRPAWGLSQDKSRSSGSLKQVKFLASALPFPLSGEREADQPGGSMSLILILIRKWNRSYRVLRYGNGFGLFDSVRYGLWLARG